jgi:hypothetical protein
MIGLLAIPGWVAAAAEPFANRYVTSRMSYSTGMGLILAIPLFPLVGTLAGQIGAVRGRRAAARAAG